MKVFYEQQNLRMSKFVYTLNPQPKFFRRSAPLFRGGFLFRRCFEMSKFLLFRGGFLFHWGFLFRDGRYTIWVQLQDTLYRGICINITIVDTETDMQVQLKSNLG